MTSFLGELKRRNVVKVAVGYAIDGFQPERRFDPVRDDPIFQALVERYRRE